MKPLASGMLVFTLVAGAPHGTDAQGQVVVEPPPTEPGQGKIILEPPLTEPAPTSTPTPAPTPPLPTYRPIRPYEEHHREELAWRAFKSRNVFIGSTVATAVGAALVFPAEANQCTSLEVAEMAGVRRCTPGGTAMIAFGYPLILIGGITMLAGAIAFGVTKSKLRRYDARTARKNSRTLRWDQTASQFVF